jgi:hypothetical protein
MSGRGLLPSGLVINRLRSAFSVGRASVGAARSEARTRADSRRSRLLIEYRKVFTASMLDARTSTGPGLIVDTKLVSWSA